MGKFYIHVTEGDEGRWNFRKNPAVARRLRSDSNLVELVKYDPLSDVTYFILCDKSDKIPFEKFIDTDDNLSMVDDWAVAQEKYPLEFNNGKVSAISKQGKIDPSIVAIYANVIDLVRDGGDKAEIDEFMGDSYDEVMSLIKAEDQKLFKKLSTLESTSNKTLKHLSLFENFNGNIKK